MLASALGILWLVDLRAVGHKLEHFRVSFIVAFLLLSLPLYLLYAWRWHFTAARIGAPLRFRRAYLDYYLSTLLNQVLPVGVAGDVVRAARHRGRLGGKEWGPAARAVILERFSGVAALAVFVVASAGLWLLRGRDSFVIVGAGALAVMLCAGLVLSLRTARWRWLERVASDGRVALVERGALGFQLAVSIASVAILLLMFACAGRAVGVDLRPTMVFQVVPLVLAATAFPWAFAGWGAREASAAALFSLVGIDAAAGVAVSIAFGILSLVAAAPGLIVLCLPRSEDTPS
jgi:uncharacterized membrane protein YbhN (UPF0104 family)